MQPIAVAVINSNAPTLKASSAELAQAGIAVADEINTIQTIIGESLPNSAHFKQIFCGVAIEHELSEKVKNTLLNRGNVLHPITKVHAVLDRSVPHIGAPAVWSLLTPVGR